MKRSFLLVTLWLTGIIIITIFVQRNFEFTPTFPYYQSLDIYPKLIQPAGYFDGVNYLRITTQGYAKNGGETAFFPLYPLLIRFVSNLGILPLYIGIALNLLCLLFIDKKLLLFLLLFPTSFYLAVNYTESFFILLTIAFFTSLRSKKYFPASLLSAVASGTKIFGAIFGVILLIKFIEEKRFNIRHFLLLILSELGLLGYAFYLHKFVGDPLSFIHSQTVFDMGRSGGQIILLPQVLYRYGMMLLYTPLDSFIYYRIVLELATFIFSIFLLFKYWPKLEVSEKVFSTWAIFLPSLSGTFVSFPRYAIILIPLFIQFVRDKSIKYRPVYAIVSAILLALNIAMYVRGIFIA